MGRGRCCSPCCLLKVVLSASVISFVGVIVSEWMLASDATRDTFGPTTATMDFATPYPSGREFHNSS